MKKYDTLVFIGRFQPVHSAHLEIIRRATHLAYQVIVIVGSANQPRTYKNPFTSQEREHMLKESIQGMSDQFGSNWSVKIEHNIDTIYNDQAWATRVQGLVAKNTLPSDRVGIIGHDKDQSSAYLGFFPQWPLEEVGLIEPLNATNIRELYIKNDANMNFIKHVVPDSTFNFLVDFRKTTAFKQLVNEREFIDTYKLQFASLKYPPVFVTTDAVVIQSGHVLLVERKSEPGKGLLALPGGFLNQHERIVDGVIRELKEETKIKVPAAVLRGNIKKIEVFDHPDRSLRGRTITHACFIELPHGELPKVKGSDDAKTANWYPLSEIDSSNMFEDHYQIIQTMLGS
jgi:bifunctional NMN adenylyltransferase/nudix hydrolase